MQFTRQVKRAGCATIGQSKQRALATAILSAAAVAAIVPSIANAQVSGSWKATGGGNWSNVANWSGSGYPDGGGVATLGTSITAAATVTLDTNVNLSQLAIT